MIRKLFFGGATALVVATLALLGAQIASAHSRPIRFDVAPGSVLTAAPATISGWFTSDIRSDPNWSFIHVQDAQGNRVDVGDTTLSKDRREMTANLKPGLAAGRYLVTWRTWDDGDGEIFGNCFTIFVGQDAANQALSSNYRLDGGKDCAAIEVSAKVATPDPNATPSAQATTAADEAADAASDSSSGGGSKGIPAWGLGLGIIGGVVVGGLGGRFIGSRP